MPPPYVAAHDPWHEDGYVSGGELGIPPNAADLNPRMLSFRAPRNFHLMDNNINSIYNRREAVRLLHNPRETRGLPWTPGTSGA